MGALIGEAAADKRSEETIASRFSRRFTSLSTLGYGIVCGLAFPLMISSTFLQEMSLSHGAGNSFGVLFFVSYAITMLLTSVVRIFRRSSVHRFSMPLAFLAVFAGNTLMLLNNVGILASGWLYALAAATLIGFGLATGELGWLEKIADQQSRKNLDIATVMPLSFVSGAIVACVIFFLSRYFELGFALIIVVLSALLIRGMPAESKHPEEVIFSRSGVLEFFKAAFYLAVFSFVFGAVSQVAVTTKTDLLSIELQAILGIVIAAALMILGRKHSRNSSDTSGMYGILFPVVAVALVAMPFVTSPLLHILSTTFVFVAYYLSSINVRIIICKLGIKQGVSSWVYLGAALGFSAFLILAGVWFGSNVIALDSPMTGLAMVSLISLFVLSMIPVITSSIEKKWQQETVPALRPLERREAQNPHSAAQAQAVLFETYATQHGLTTRESEVFALICQGRTRSYIADELGLSPNTIKGYIHNVYQKCNAHDKQDLIDRVELFQDKNFQSEELPDQ